MNYHLVLIFSFGIITFLLGMMLIPPFINLVKDLNLGKQIRDNALSGKAKIFSKLHKNKKGTPTMGGVVILMIVFIMVFFSMILQYFDIIKNSLLNQKETYLPLFTLFTVGTIGLIDDLMNIKGIGKTKGLSAKFKMFWLILFALMGGLWFYFKLGWGDRGLDLAIIEPIKLGIFFIPLFILVIISTSNSVNLTDGLDGLAGGLLLFAYSVYGYITYDQGLYLLSTLCIAIVGALTAFLWYNVKPAKFYMGDVGSLALGANLGLIAMLTNTVFILLVVGAIFIFETISVIIQMTSKKFRKGKKVFLVAPFHHHLEAIGRTEENVVFRLWLIGLVLSIIGIIFYIIQK